MAHATLPWVPEDIFFLSTLMVRGQAALTRDSCNEWRSLMQLSPRTRNFHTYLCIHDCLVSIPFLLITYYTDEQFELVF